MPFVEVFTRQELPEAVRAKLAETLIVTMMNIEIGYPTDHAREKSWIWFHTLPGTSWAVGGRFDDTYIKGRKMGLARIIAPEGLLCVPARSTEFATLPTRNRHAKDTCNPWAACRGQRKYGEQDGRRILFCKVPQAAEKTQRRTGSQHTKCRMRRY